MTGLERSASQAAGPGGTARALGASLVALLRVRAELAAVELEEETGRWKRVIALGLVAAVFLALSLLLVAFLVVVYFWDTWRLSAIGGVTLVYFAIGAWAFVRIRQTVRDGPPPFSATLGEFRKDLELLQGRDE